MTRILTFGAAAAAAVALAACGPLLDPQARAEREFDRMIADPQKGGQWRALKTAFPEDYAKLRAEMVGLMSSGRSDQAARTEAMRLVRADTLRRMGHVAAAPPADLKRWMDAERRVIHALQRENVQACAEFGMTGLQRPYEFSEAAVKVMDESGAVVIHTAKAGMDSPTRHRASTQADWAALEATMVRIGIDPRVRGLFTQGLDRASVADQCVGSVALYDSLVALEDEHAAPIIAEIARQAIPPPTPAPASP